MRLDLDEKEVAILKKSLGFSIFKLRKEKTKVTYKRGKSRPSLTKTRQQWIDRIDLKLELVQGLLNKLK